MKASSYPQEFLKIVSQALWGSSNIKPNPEFLKLFAYLLALIYGKVVKD